MHHSITINIKGESFRLKEKRKAGMLASERPEEKESLTDEWPFEEKKDKEPAMSAASAGKEVGVQD